jgi:hypothetical protein
MEFINFIKEKTGLQKLSQETFTGKNFYFINGENSQDNRVQIEFIGATKKYFYTLYVRGILQEMDYLHDDIVNYVKSLNLGKNIIVDTETRVTMC